MNRMPDIGARVRFTRADRPVRTVTGTVTKHYPGLPARDEHGRRYTQEDAVCIRVDRRPSWWPYCNSDLFAPDISEIEPI